MVAELRNMFGEMSRQNQDAIFHGFQRGAQHVAEQMDIEQHRRAMAHPRLCLDLGPEGPNAALGPLEATAANPGNLS